jgi:DNA-binding transcriptional ArsR family regulator
MRLNGGCFGGGEACEVFMASSLLRKYDDHRTKAFDSRRTMDLDMPRTLHHPDTGALELTDVLHALSDPVRLEIVRTLASEGGCERRCGAFDLTVTKSTRTHHFRVLRESGLIEQASEGTAVVNRLRREDVDARFPGLLDSVLGV